MALAEQGTPMLGSGRRVRVTSLSERVHLNGRVGTIHRRHACGAWKVIMENGDKFAFKEENLDASIDGASDVHLGEGAEQDVYVADRQGQAARSIVIEDRSVKVSPSLDTACQNHLRNVHAHTLCVKQETFEAMLADADERPSTDAAPTDRCDDECIAEDLPQGLPDDNFHAFCISERKRIVGLFAAVREHLGVPNTQVARYVRGNERAIAQRLSQGVPLDGLFSPDFAAMMRQAQRVWARRPPTQRELDAVKASLPPSFTETTHPTTRRRTTHENQRRKCIVNTKLKKARQAVAWDSQTNQWRVHFVVKALLDSEFATTRASDQFWKDACFELSLKNVHGAGVTQAEAVASWMNMHGLIWRDALVEWRRYPDILTGDEVQNTRKSR